MKKLANKGFTLIELLIVVMILAILLGLILINVSAIIEGARVSEATGIFGQGKTMASVYEVKFGRFPVTFEEMKFRLDPEYVNEDTYEGKYFTFTLAGGDTADPTIVAERGNRNTGDCSNKYGCYTLTYHMLTNIIDLEGGNCGGSVPMDECREDLLHEQQMP